MTNTPQPVGRYAAPRTDVTDLTVPDPLLSARPRSVVWACELMLVSTVIGLISLLPVVDPPMPGEPAAMTALIWGMTLVLAAIEDWARLPLVAGLSIASALSSAAGAALLLAGASVRWFKPTAKV